MPSFGVVRHTIRRRLVRRRGLCHVREIAMPSGTVKWFDVKKGFGFIQAASCGKDIFVHFSAIESEGFKSLKDGEAVEYELAESDRGPQATKVRRLKPQ